MKVKMYCYSVVFSEISDVKEGEFIYSEVKAKTIESPVRLNLITLHNQLRKEFGVDKGEPVGYLCMHNINLQIMDKVYQEVI